MHYNTKKYKKTEFFFQSKKKSGLSGLCGPKVEVKKVIQQ
jgi:hypothetical protein